VFTHLFTLYFSGTFCCTALETEEKVAEMRRILTEELPDDKYFILKYVAHFLTEVLSGRRFISAIMCCNVMIVCPETMSLL